LAGVHPFVLKKLWPIARRASLKRVQNLAERVAAADARMKLGADGWTLIVGIVGRI
jgi:hypothetical protein